LSSIWVKKGEFSAALVLNVSYLTYSGLSHNNRRDDLYDDIIKFQNIASLQLAAVSNHSAKVDEPSATIGEFCQSGPTIQI
jgi:hypothetical protein